MTVFITFAPADRAPAEALEKFVERRGQFVEMDDGSTALRPVQANDAVVLLISKDLVFAPSRLRLEQRALDAWSEGRLVVVKLDHGIAPVGLRDLSFIDASFEAAREHTWLKVADAVRDAMRAPRPAPSPQETENEEGSSGGDAAPFEPAARKSSPLLRAVLLFLLAVPGCIAIAATAAIFLVNRIGATPGGLPELRAGIDAFGVRYGLPHGVTEWVFLATALVTLCVIVFTVVSMVRRPRARAQAPARVEQAAPAPPPEASDEVFVSYASANAPVVLPVIDGASETGARFWLDRKGIAAGQGWAGEIVRAIRAAPRVVIMCSKAAFESDHVKREIYLADRYNKRVLPVFIEEATPPEDFEYFFAGVQFLKLFETPEAERPAALAQALGA